MTERENERIKKRKKEDKKAFTIHLYFLQQFTEAHDFWKVELHPTLGNLISLDLSLRQKALHKWHILWLCANLLLHLCVYCLSFYLSLISNTKSLSNSEVIDSYKNAISPSQHTCKFFMTGKYRGQQIIRSLRFV